MARPHRLAPLAVAGMLAACSSTAGAPATDPTPDGATSTVQPSVAAPGLDRDDATPDAPSLDRETMGAVPPLQHSDSTAASSLTRESAEILSDLDAQQVESGTRITLPDTVLFEFDEATLKPSAQAVLDDLVTVITEVAPAPVTIDGHTDGMGSDAYNQDLSERRAAAVATYFVDAGVDPAQLTSTGHGESQPLVEETDAAGDDDPDARARNRRVEITIEGISPTG